MTETYVVGVGMHPFGRFPDKTVPQLARDAIWAAIEDAGVDPRWIDAAYVANCYNGFFTGQGDAIAPMVFGRAGLSGMPMIHVEGGGAAGSVAFHQAVLAVMSGEYRLALAVGVEKIYVPGNPAISISAIGTSGEQTTATRLGLTWIGDLTMSARRLMGRYGWTARDFATVAAKNRRHGVHNPESEIRQEMSVEEVLAARMVAPPLTRPMCAGAAVDGASAVLIADRETSARIGAGRHPRVAGMGVVGARYISNRVTDERPGMLSMDEAGRSFAKAYEKAGLGPEDVDLAQVHDSVAPEELLSYQVMGLCAPGEEAALLRSGATALGGRVPVNTDGGLIARGHPISASGVAQVVETTRQLRGSAGPRQVEYDGRAPRVGAIQNAGAQGGPAAGVAVSAAFLLQA
ncbi:MAG TPA: thiolase family protein [Amycolatopsis sp.]|nr:thiolase family protein [Amycolatopsis sp.]